MTKITKGASPSGVVIKAVNKSGMNPSGDRVIIVPEDIKTSMIAIPEDAMERQRAAAAIGRIVAIGETAFLFEERKYDIHLREMYQPGTRVIFAMYGGQILKGRDNKEYRLIRDADVLARCDEDVEQKIR